MRLPIVRGTSISRDSKTGTIVKVSPGGLVSTVLSGLQTPGGLALDGSGDLYFTDTNGKQVERLDPSGNLTNFGAGTWSAPRGIAVSAAGDVYVADAGLQQILKIDSNGNVARHWARVGARISVGCGCRRNGNRL